jgi:hypothetical protein
MAPINRLVHSGTFFYSALNNNQFHCINFLWPLNVSWILAVESTFLVLALPREPDNFVRNLADPKSKTQLTVSHACGSASSFLRT